MEIFDSFGLCVDFLDSDPATWNKRDDFTRNQSRVNAISVENDVAVKLASDFNLKLTHGEERSS